MVFTNWCVILYSKYVFILYDLEYFFTISVLPFPLLSSECRKFQTAGNFQGCFCEVIQLSSVLPFIYIQKNWTKEDIRRKVTTKLF